ncbi:MAG: barstar family protein [Eubacteriales bacterium]|nr:barstar family protein [Eubacteriales bacterium]
MLQVYLNGRDFESPEEVHEFLAKELEFPAYYGRNLSALYDVLTDISDDTRIVIDLSGVEDDTMLDMLERMVEVMTDAADENEYLEIECMER